MNKPRSKRRYTIRSLLILIAILALPLAVVTPWFRAPAPSCQRGMAAIQGAQVDCASCHQGQPQFSLALAAPMPKRPRPVRAEAPPPGHAALGMGVQDCKACHTVTAVPER